MNPPPLSWVPSFSDSLSRALGCSVQQQLHATVNPLVYKLEIHFSEPQPPKRLGLIWNLLQMYAAANDAVAEYRWQAPQEPGRLVVRLAMKERLGLPKDVRPWEK